MNDEKNFSSKENKNSIHKKSKKVKCPKCKLIEYTIVKEKCDCFGVILMLICFGPYFFICLCFGEDVTKKYVHYCKNCGYDCTNVKQYEENECCILI